MTIHVDKEQEWDPFVKKVMEKLKELEDKIDLVKSNTELMIKSSGKITKEVK